MIEQDGDVVTVSGIELLAQTYRAVLQAIARRRANGLSSGELHDLARALRAAHTASLECRQLDTAPAGGEDCEYQSACDWCNVAEAANLLLLSRRQVQRLAESGRLEARRAGRVWQLRRAPLLVLAKERDDRVRRPDLLSILGA